MTITEPAPIDLLSPLLTPRERLWDTIDFITGNSRWRQCSYETCRWDECGSAYCLAGWIAVRAGYKTLGTEMPGWVRREDVPDWLLRKILDIHILQTDDELSGAVHVAGIAEALLGITHTAGELLWDGNNNLDRIKRLAYSLVGPRP